MRRALPLRVTSLGNACSTLDALASAFKDDIHRPYVLSYEPYVQKKRTVLSGIFMRDRKPLKYKGRALLAVATAQLRKTFYRVFCKSRIFATCRFERI